MPQYDIILFDNTHISPNRRKVNKRGIATETREWEFINRSDLKSGLGDF